MKRSIISCVILFCLICLTGCKTKTPRYIINPPFKWNTETGKSWVFVQGYWLPIRDPDKYRFRHSCPVE